MSRARSNPSAGPRANEEQPCHHADQELQGEGQGLHRFPQGVVPNPGGDGLCPDEDPRHVADHGRQDIPPGMMGAADQDDLLVQQRLGAGDGGQRKNGGQIPSGAGLPPR